MNPSELLDGNMEWAAGVARGVAARLPKSFDKESMIQEATIALWKAAEQYDPSRGVPFRAWAWPMVRGAVYMSVRRRNYRDATMDALPAVMVETRPNVEQQVIAAEEAEAVNAWALAMVKLLPASEAYLVQRHCLDGVTIEELAACWHVERGEMNRRVRAGVNRLKALARSQELRGGKAA